MTTATDSVKMEEAQPAPEIALETRIQDFRAPLEGKLEPEKIDAAEESLRSNDIRAYPATGSIVSMIFYTQVQVSCENRTFDGKAGSMASPGGGFLAGHVYTADLARLFRDTTNFNYDAKGVYTAIYFWDRHARLLGTFQAGSVSTVTGAGVGAGSWS